LFVMLFFVPMAALAGVIAGEGSPTTAGGGAMNTLEDIYNLINLGTTNVPRAGIFTEPTAGPVATGHTLTQVYDRAKTSSRPARTGQTPTVPLDVTAIDGADGKLQKGVVWPSQRFTAINGTVTDNLTGLIWLQYANCFGSVSWATALTSCNTLANGTCSLSDGSAAGVWRLPNLRELQSLIDYGRLSPALPADHPFGSVQSDGYWSSATYAANTDGAWRVYLSYGHVSSVAKTSTHSVWPVRGGQ
jgi:hypothetical protein